MSIEAMKQASEALALVARSDEWLGCQTYEGQIATSAYEALRQAIAEAEDAVAEEREACAKVCEEEAQEAYHQEASYLPQGNLYLLHIAEGAKRCADSIKARGVHARPVVHAVRCTYPQCQATNGCVGACSKGQSEKQEPVAQAGDEGYRTGINDERMSEANIGIAGFGAKVEPARNNPYRTPPAAPVHASDMSEKHVHESDKDRHELAGTIPISNGGIATSTPTDFFALPKREWVGLSDKEVTSIIREWHWMPYELCKVIEAKLKEKNT